MVMDALKSYFVTTTVVDCDTSLPPRPDVARVTADVLAEPDRDAWIGMVREASVIVVSLPERVTTAVVAVLAEYAPHGALLVETCSVKGSVARDLETLWKGRPALGINPLFRPSLGLWRGRAVALVRYVDSAIGARIESMFAAGGASFVIVDAVEHDRTAAVTQALTHATLLLFGTVFARSTTDVSATAVMAMAPPPFRVLLALSVRIATGEMSVYRDIQDTPDARAVPTTLRDALDYFQDAVRTDAALGGLCAAILEALGPDLTASSALTAEGILSSLLEVDQRGDSSSA